MFYFDQLFLLDLFSVTLFAIYIDIQEESRLVFSLCEMTNVE